MFLICRVVIFREETLLHLLSHCRAALQEEGLKRWEIGEVASRIGQASFLFATMNCILFLPDDLNLP